MRSKMIGADIFAVCIRYKVTATLSLVSSSRTTTDSFKIGRTGMYSESENSSIGEFSCGCYHYLLFHLRAILSSVPFTAGLSPGATPPNEFQNAQSFTDPGHYR